MRLAILLVAGVACLMPMAVKAQSSNCDTRCVNQFTVCQNSAEAVLELCLDRAGTARQKAVCAAAFTRLEDACRTNEATCLGNCPAS